MYLRKEKVLSLYSSLVARQDPLSMGIFPSGEDLAFRISKIAGCLSIWERCDLVVIHLRDTQDFPLYGFLWGPRLCWTHQLHAHLVRLLLAPSASPSSVRIFLRQLYSMVRSLCKILDPSSANVGLTDLRASPMPMHDVSRLWSEIPLSATPYSMVSSTLADRLWSTYEYLWTLIMTFLKRGVIKWL